MLTVSTQSVLEGVLKRAGIVTSDASAADKAAILDFISDRLATAKEYYRWPVYTKVEQRWFRPVWAAASTYTAGTEVYYTPTDTYYTCVTTTSAGEDPEDTPAKWSALENYNHQVNYEQTGFTDIALVIGAYDSDPRAYADALPLPYQLREAGVGFAPDIEETSVWVEYLAPADSLAATVYDAAAAYAVDDLIYYTDGEVWKCITATTAGQTPVTHAAKWQLVPFPAFLARAVKMGALKDWSSSGEKELSAKLEQMQEERFIELLDDQVWLITKLQGQTGRPTVRPGS